VIQSIVSSSHYAYNPELLEDNDTLEDTEELVSKVRSFDIAHQYVEAGIDDVQGIIRAVENGIDASILLSFSPSLSEN
jgi:hypothetical protein